jgi:hypothetical protein
MYVDFMLDNKTNTWYKLPYYLNDDKQICYLDFEIKMKFIKTKLNIPIYYSKTNFEEEEEEYTYEERNARRTLFKEGVNDHKVEEGEIIRLSNEERVWTAPFANVVSDDLLW